MPLYMPKNCLYVPCFMCVISTYSPRIPSISVFEYSTGIPVSVSLPKVKSAEFGVQWYFGLLGFALRYLSSMSLELSVFKVIT